MTAQEEITRIPFVKEVLLLSIFTSFFGSSPTFLPLFDVVFFFLFLYVKLWLQNYKLTDYQCRLCQSFCSQNDAWGHSCSGTGCTQLNLFLKKLLVSMQGLSSISITEIKKKSFCTLVSHMQCLMALFCCASPLTSFVHNEDDSNRKFHIWIHYPIKLAATDFQPSSSLIWQTSAFLLCFPSLRMAACHSIETISDKASVNSG